jgi:hypothetical protein
VRRYRDVVPADEEFRKVAEDVRELARALRSELRAAKWEAKDAARQARREWRAYYRSGAWRDHQGNGPSWWMAPPSPPTRPVDAPVGPSPSADAPGQAAAPPPPPPPPPPPARYRRPDWSGRGWGPPPVWQPPRPARPPRPEKPRKPGKPPIRHRRDGSTLVSLLLVIIGLAWLGSETGVFAVSLEAVLATILAIVGAVMVVTARTDWNLSRRHWPVWLGFALLLVLMVSVNGPAVRGSFSSMHMGPVTTTPGWRSASYANFAGPLEVDLTSLQPGTGDITIRAHNVFGPVTVRLPPDPHFRVLVDARTSFGPVQIRTARPSAGVFTHQTGVVGSGSPVVHLDVSDAFGPVAVK